MPALPCSSWKTFTAQASNYFGGRRRQLKSSVTGRWSGQAAQYVYTRGSAEAHGAGFEHCQGRQSVPNAAGGFDPQFLAGDFTQEFDVFDCGAAAGEAGDRGDFDAAAGEKVPGLNDPRSIDTDGVKIVLARLAAQLLDVLQRRVGPQQRVIDHAGQLVCRLQVSRRRFLGSG